MYDNQKCMVTNYGISMEFNQCFGRYFILWDIVDPCTESNPEPNPNPNPEPNPKPNPNPDPNCRFTISHKMRCLRMFLSELLTIWNFLARH